MSGRILLPEAGAFYLMDHGYVDFTRLYALHPGVAFFVTQDKYRLKYHRRYSRSVDKSTGLR